ncbi:MAG: hypothetical protein FVQ80_15005 [Planctomycetes bacterium]|nr:hypothetical protein [Planctomycetota bacterium]
MALREYRLEWQLKTAGNLCGIEYRTSKPGISTWDSRTHRGNNRGREQRAAGDTADPGYIRGKNRDGKNRRLNYVSDLLIKSVRKKLISAHRIKTEPKQIACMPRAEDRRLPAALTCCCSCGRRIQKEQLKFAYALRLAGESRDVMRKAGDIKFRAKRRTGIMRKNIGHIRP